MIRLQKRIHIIFLIVMFAGLISPSGLAQNGYDQNYRPQVQFSPKSNWTNDPNGLVYFEGEYHLFFQYNPEGSTWGHMSWGHAVSPDLLHWKELPVAIPETPDEMIFTGSVVVDEKNTSGLCEGDKPCLVSVYTAHSGAGKRQREVQNIAVSQDRGRTWKSFSANPVLDLKMSDFRDPSVSWNESAHAWIMAVSLPNEHKVAFYSSPDLKQWKRESTFGPEGATGGQWECPDLLRIPGMNGTKDVWALKVGLNPGALQGGSGEQYFLGDFDGKTFIQSKEQGSHGWTDYGKDSYCAISYNHLPTGTPPTLIGWMNNWQYADKLPTAPWRGQMTLARRISVIRDQAGLALTQDPVIASQRIVPAHRIDIRVKAKDATAQVLDSKAPLELRLNIESTDASTYGLRIYSDEEHWSEIGFDRDSMKFYVDRRKSGLEVTTDFPTRTEAPLIGSRSNDIHLILDRSSISVFAQSGTIAMTNLIFPIKPDARIVFFRRGGVKALRLRGEAFPLNSIW